MVEILKELVQISLDSNQAMFTFKWLLLVPVIFFNTWVYWRALKSFTPEKKQE